MEIRDELGLRKLLRAVLAPDGDFAHLVLRVERGEEEEEEEGRESIRAETRCLGSRGATSRGAPLGFLALIPEELDPVPGRHCRTARVSATSWARGDATRTGEEERGTPGRPAPPGAAKCRRGELERAAPAQAPPSGHHWPSQAPRRAMAVTDTERKPPERSQAGKHHRAGRQTDSLRSWSPIYNQKRGPVTHQLGREHVRLAPEALRHLWRHKARAGASKRTTPPT